MQPGYGQFCPVAKAAEVFATRWTPLILRELMSDSHTFNDIHRGVPLMSRAVLVARLRELEHQGIVERRKRSRGSGHEYWLTSTGDALRPIVDVLGKWGLAHARAWLKPNDFDPTIVMWALRKRTDRDALPDHRVIVRFEFAGLPATHAKFRILWLILERSDVDICMKDPGFPIDLTFAGNIRDFVALCLGYVEWRDVGRTTLRVEGNRELVKQLPIWLRLDKVYGRDMPIVRLTA